MQDLGSRRLLWTLWVPLAAVFLATVVWQQGVFETRKDCLYCGGSGQVARWVPVPEDRRPMEYDPCPACGPLSGDRLIHWAKLVDRQLPDTLMGTWAWWATLFAAGLVWSLRRVICRTCEGAGAREGAPCEACAGRGGHARLDRWMLGRG
jgi:DnaJ-class molecular chaperone